MSMAKAGDKPNSSKWLLDVKAFAAPAFIFDVRVLELEAFVQTLAGVVELGAVDVGEALRIDEVLHPVALEGHVVGLDCVGIFELVRKAGAAGGAHAQAQADALPSLL